jgi:signal transduction histidine kinase
MLHAFVETYRDAIVAHARARAGTRPWPPASPPELDDGLALFLGQLVETLQREGTPEPFSSETISETAARHGRELFAAGFSVSQVVHAYGDLCQAVTELALDLNAPISTDEFRVLNRCLDIAIADAVTEHARITADARTSDELERIGRFAHEIRDRLNTAVIAFDVVKRGTVAVGGSTGAVLGRSLAGLAGLVDSMLADLRTAASRQRPEVISVSDLLGDIGTAAHLQAEYGGLDFTLQSVSPTLWVHADRQLLESAVTNLLSNAFKYTPAGGHVHVRAIGRGTHVCIEVQDACGGIPEGLGDLFQPFGPRRGRNRTGLGLGLSIARRAVRAQGGDIDVRNAPGSGCTFVVTVPAAQAPPPLPVPVPQASHGAHD